jgi:protein-disulfide isomerase
VSPSGKRQTRAEIARERAQAARQREQAAARRRRATIVTGIAVAVLVLAGVIAFAVAGRDDDGGSSAPAATTDGGFALPRGQADAPVTLTVFEDFRCPACQVLEERLGPTIEKLTDEGVLRVDYHIASFLDSNLGGSGSVDAANAAACAADAGKFPEFHDVLYANQPSEGADTFGDTDALLDLAGQVDGLRSDAFDSCVRDGTYEGWVEDVQEAFDKRFNGQVSTPSVLLNGEGLQTPTQDQVSPALASPEAFEAAVREAAGAAGSSTPTPAASAATP